MNDRQKKFIAEYLIHGNATKAYMIAYNTDNQKNARECSCRLIKHPKVIVELDRLQRERMERVMWTAEEILQEIKDIAHSDEATKSEKLKALELAAKSLGMFRDKVEHSGGISITLGKEIEDWAE